MLKTKLYPGRFPGMSNKMAAFVAYILGEKYTTPWIEHILASEKENSVLVHASGDIGYNQFDALSDLRDNWNRLLSVAGLTEDEMRVAKTLFKERVGVPS